MGGSEKISWTKRGYKKKIRARHRWENNDHRAKAVYASRGLTIWNACSCKKVLLLLLAGRGDCRGDYWKPKTRPVNYVPATTVTFVPEEFLQTLVCEISLFLPFLIEVSKMQQWRRDETANTEKVAGHFLCQKLLFNTIEH